MADERGPARTDPDLDPDISRAGDLPTALQAQFDRIGSPARSEHVSAAGRRHVAASVSGPKRHADVVMGLEERAFCLQLWTRGVLMCSGATGELAALAGAVHDWQSGLPISDLTAAWRFLESNGFAEAFERGEAEAIDYVWHRYRDNRRGQRN